MSSVRVERSDGVAIVTIDSPPANALDRAWLTSRMRAAPSSALHRSGT
jgi:enoyl-CoA hydratase/carnithine racemase